MIEESKKQEPQTEQETKKDSLFLYFKTHTNVLISVVMCVVTLYDEYRGRPRYKRNDLQTIRKDIEKEKREIKYITDKVNEEADKLLNPMQMKNVPDLFCNRNIFLGLMYYVTVLAMLILIGLSSINENTKNQTSFNIFSEAETTYVIIYANNGIYYMDEAIVYGDTILINTEKHRVLL